MKQEATVNLVDGKSISFETGKLAKQAHGSVVVRIGENVVLATACANAQPRPGGGDFFPLTVDYREYTYAGGRIPGGFIKREGRPSEREILVSRQIDRPIRPLFPESFRNETQVIAFVLSADSDNDPDVAAINGASCALAVSDIPFHGPVGAVRVGLLDDKFVVNPTYSEIHESKLNLMVVGTAEAIVMIEAGASEIQEDRVVDAIEFGHGEIKKICAVISELAAARGQAEAAGRAGRDRRALSGGSACQDRRAPGGRSRYAEAPKNRELSAGRCPACGVAGGHSGRDRRRTEQAF